MKFSIRDLLLVTAMSFVGTTMPVMAADGDSKKLESELEGSWLVELMEEDGKRSTDAVGETAILSRGKFEERLADGSIHRGTYVLDVARKPARIQVRWDDNKETQKGIIDLNGDSLVICFGGDKYPEQFKTKKGSGRVAFFYKRQQRAP